MGRISVSCTPVLPLGSFSLTPTLSRWEREALRTVLAMRDGVRALTGFDSTE
jgi:hypothetical protein